MRLNYLLVLSFIFLLTLPIKAQKGDLIAITPEIGKIINVTDRDYFCLWQSFDNYNSARIFKLGSSYTLEIVYFEGTKQISRSFKITPEYIQVIRDWINNFEDAKSQGIKFALRAPDKPQYVSLDKKNFIDSIDWSAVPKSRALVKIRTIYKNNYRGILSDIINPQMVLLRSNSALDTVRINSISDLKLVKKNKVLKSFVVGGLAGAALGVGAMFYIGSGLGIGAFPIMGGVLGSSGGLIVGLFRGIDSNLNFRDLTELERLKVLVSIMDKR